MELEQRAVIRYYLRKGKGSKAIKAKLDKVYGEEAYSLPLEKKWLQKFRGCRERLINLVQPGRPSSDLTESISAFLHEQPFASIKVIAKALRVTKETIKTNLVNQMGYQKFNLRCILIASTPETKNA